MKETAADRDLGKLEGDGAGVTNYPRTDFDQPGLQAGQRPVGHLLGQICVFQEDTQIVGQGMKLQAYLVLRHPFARQPCPVDRLLTLFDMPLCFAAIVVKPDDPDRYSGLPRDVRNTLSTDRSVSATISRLVGCAVVAAARIVMGR
jgi:hypothetical protein